MNGSRFSKGLLLLCAIALLFGAAVPYGASAAESGDQPASFKDLRSSYWAYNDIMELAALNIVSGFTDGTFRPNDDITREQFLKMLVELIGFPTDSRDVPFRDVAPTRWSVPHIAAGVAHGILDVRDYPDGFKPDQPITRLEMAIWIVRALKLEPQTEETMLMTLKDQAEIRSRRDLIEAALRTGIIRGYPDGTFKGGNQSTRAEAAAMAVRALHYLRNQPSSPGSGAARKIVEYLPNVKMGKSKRYYKRDDRTWVIEDSDLVLSPGDVFVMPPNDEFYGGIAKKVVSVREENGALVVTTSVPKVREVFARLEVRTTEAIDPRLLVPADPSIEIVESPAPAPVRLASVQPAALQLPCFIIRMNNVRYDGFALDAGINFCNLGVDADIGLDVDVDWFDVDLDFYAKLVLLGDVTTNVNIRANRSITTPVYIPLTAPYYVPVVPGVFIKGQFYLKIEPDFRASLEIRFEDRFHLEQGFSFSSGGGFRTIDNTTNTATLEVNSGANAALAAGPDFQLTLTLLDIAYAGFELYPGIRAGFYRQVDSGRCDEVRVDAFLRLDVVAGYDVWVAAGNLNRTLINASFPLFEEQLACPVPPAPGNLSARPVREIILPAPVSLWIIDRISVQLNWSPAANATSYRVKRADSPGGPFQTIRSNLNAVSYLDTSTERGKTYYYQVVAVNAYGESAPSATVTARTADLPPPNPTNLKAAREGRNVKLEWDRMDGPIFADRSSPFSLLEHNGVKYNVRRSDRERGGMRLIASNLTSPSFTDMTASPDEAYVYVVTAVDQYGESGYSNFAYVPKGSSSESDLLIEKPWFLPLLIPPAPDQVVAEAGYGEVVLSWSPVEGATGYHVKRADAADGTYATIGSGVADTMFKDKNVENGKTYYYKVTAINNLGFESGDSPVRSATPGFQLGDILLPDLQMPGLFGIAAPEHFQAATDVGSGRVVLSWDKVAGAAGYNVWRSEAANGAFEKIGSMVAGTTFTDTTAAIGRTYYYKVTAVSALGIESPATPVRSATPSRGVR